MACTSRAHLRRKTDIGRLAFFGEQRAHWMMVNSGRANQPVSKSNLIPMKNVRPLASEKRPRVCFIWHQQFTRGISYSTEIIFQCATERESAMSKWWNDPGQCRIGFKTKVFSHGMAPKKPNRHCGKLVMEVQKVATWLLGGPRNRVYRRLNRYLVVDYSYIN